MHEAMEDGFWVGKRRGEEAITKDRREKGMTPNEKEGIMLLK